MSRVSTYLNFQGKTEEAFRFYAAAFGTEIEALGRMGDVPSDPNGPQLTEAEKNMVMHVEITILAGHVLMGTDAIESFGHKVAFGNNMSINLEPDTRAEAERLHAALFDGGTEVMPLTDMFWGAYFGTGVDRYGIRWMFNCNEPAA